MKKLDKTAAGKISHPVRILQFGEGNFLRAFFDWMIDIANERGVTDTGIAIVSPRFKENETIRNLRKQDCLYHVCLEGIENGKPKQESRMITSVADAFSPTADPELYREYITSPDLRFVISNTTEAGIKYEKDDVSTLFASTFPGKITALLHHRYRHFKGDTSKGLVFLCCELIEDNGTLLREYVLRHAEEAGLEKEFSKWVEKSCIFCDTLVDRIVSGFPSDTIDDIKASLGYDDNLVVKGELYHVWAIGGKDADKVREELPLDRACLNVHFMPSVSEFREKKVRILNGSHTGMTAIALQAGCETVLDAFNNPDICTFIKEMVKREVLPTIEGDEAELTNFANCILERFYNPYIRHLLKSISLNSLSKWETRNFPVIRDFRKKHGKHAEFEIFTFAALLTLYSPESAFDPDDNAEHIRFISDSRACGDTRQRVERIVKGDIFSEDFEEAVPGFCEKAAEYVDMIQEYGMPEALRKFLDSHCSK